MGWEWIEDLPNVARYYDPRSGWDLRCQIDRPEHGFRIVLTDKTESASAISLIPPTNSPDANTLSTQTSRQLFPSLAETYFRGEDAIALFPQSEDAKFGLCVTYRVVGLSEQWLAVETIVALETNLLDSHPTVDLVLRGTNEAFEDLEVKHGASVITANNGPSLQRKTVAPAAAYITSDADVAGDAAESHMTTVLMFPPSDQAAAGLIAQEESLLQIRLLAEFLEKGVIRKTRYWVTFWRHRPTYAEILDCYIQLQQEPLPLTP